MPLTSVRRVIRAASLPVIVAVAMAIGGGSAMASEQLHQRGSVGHYSYADSSGTPGGHCRYDGTAGTQYFKAVRVDAPTAYWPDQSSENAHEHGKITMQVRLQHWNGSAWKLVLKGGKQTASASETTAAALHGMTVHWSGPDHRKFRAVVVLTWRHVNGTFEGRSTDLIDNYSRSFDGLVSGACPSIHHDFG
jgi:hypothetical protein